MMGRIFLLASAPPAPGPTRTVTILQALRRSSLVLTGVLALALRAAGGQAVEPSATYVREHWTVADGLPINSITSLVQTRDGYLWLGTNDGVVRFDGVRFTVYNAGNTPEIPSNRIVSLHEDRAGALWILTEQQHLVRYLRGQFTHINAARGLNVGAVRLTEAGDGTIVLATTRGAGIVQNGLFVPLVDSLSIEYGYGGAVKRRDGSVWLKARSQLWRIANGRVEDVTPRAIRAPSVLRLGLDSEDRLWLSDTSGIWVEDGRWRNVQRADGPVNDVDNFAFDARGRRAWVISRKAVDVVTDTIARRVTRFAGPGFTINTTIALDSAGTAWYANGPELFHDGRRVVAFDGLPGDYLAPGAIDALTIDREGSVWVGTRASGLHRLKPSLFSVVSVPEGFGRLSFRLGDGWP